MNAWFPAFSVYNICMYRTLKCTVLRYKIYTDLHGEFPKVSNNFASLLCLFHINYISIHPFHAPVGGMPTAMKNVLVRDADGMQYANCVMPQVVEAELRTAEAFYGPLESV